MKVERGKSLVTHCNILQHTATHCNARLTNVRCGVATISRLLKVQVSFAEYRLFYRALLQKRPIFLRSLLIVATPSEKSPAKDHRLFSKTNK